MPTGGVPALVAQLDALTADLADLQEAYAEAVSALANTQQDYVLVAADALEVGMLVVAAGGEPAFDPFPAPRRKIAWEVVEVLPDESPEGYIRTRILVRVAASETPTEYEVNPSSQTREWHTNNWALVYTGSAPPWDVSS